MERRALNIAVLTSSRADYGIWLPLLQRFKLDALHHVELIAFGTHLSPKHGHTIDAILNDGFEVQHRLDTLPDGDSPADIASAMGKTMQVFAQFWNAYAKQFDVVLCLGDRYEMFAAVAASAPFGVRVAHVHGGETTLGAIDNAFRHSITHFAQLHFVSAPAYAERVQSLTEKSEGIYTVGALSLDNLRNMELLTPEELTAQFHVTVDKQTILCTFHPETIAHERNADYGNELIAALLELTNHHVIITLPNADTSGDTLRRMFVDTFAENERVQLVENLGTRGYMSVMKHCGLMLGNTSSGILEAASLGKYVIDLGERQRGRAHGSNVVHVAIERAAIVNAVREIGQLGDWNGTNMYDIGGAAEGIVLAIENELC